MSDYRRCYIPGGTYFFTLVTYSRIPLFANAEARKIFYSAWQYVKDKHPFETVAYCLSPDHLHCIWSLPEGDANYSLRWKEIKRLFSHQYVDLIGKRDIDNPSRKKRKEQVFWQRRFWEHTIRDGDDLTRHVDYIHYNPVKHGFVQRVQEWRWSSFHRFVEEGCYEVRWGKGMEKVLDPFHGGVME